MIRHVSGDLPFFSYKLFQPYDEILSVVSTRLGGVSPTPYHSLNLGFSVGDERTHVIENRTRYCQAVDVDIQNVTVGHLIQGTHIEIVTPREKGRGAVDPETGLPGTDGMITNTPNVALLLLVADCAAITFYDPKRHVLGLGHGGWRGTVGGIARKIITRMNEVFDCNPADLLIGVSPSIGPCCYQVRDDVIQVFQQAYPAHASQFFVPQPDGTVHLDVWTALRWQLLDSGIQPEHIEFAGICTACHTDLFYSYRAEKGKTGRFGALVMLKNTSAF